MLKKSLKGLDKKTLRRWVVLFFLGLAIPTAYLIQQSYSRLKWETYHQHQLMADELSNRINSEFSRLINIEEQRAFTDYSFLNIAGDPKAQLLQRSPLSNFPVESEITGLIGYFQVSNNGELMTPFVPDAIKKGSSAVSFGISQIELDSRITLENKIQAILSRNNLVKSREPLGLDKKVFLEESDNSSSILGGLASRKRSKAAPSQEAFDQLKESVPKRSANKFKRLDDLKFSNKAKAVVSKQNVRKSAKLNQLVRKEKNVLPESELKDSENSVSGISKSDVSEITQDTSTQDTSIREVKKKQTQPTPSSPKRSLKIRTFESTIDPFEFSLLDSGHFVLYRDVWLNDQRYIQGLLIEQKAFLENIINLPFRDTSLFQMSNLLVIHQESVLTAFSGQNTLGYLSNSNVLNGELLYQTRLSAPLSDIQLLFSINQLPSGAGGKVILWLSAILASILCIGFYLMYRLGLSQINLAKQQQDFVSAVSHELKTPLTSIRMYGELLREGWATEEKKKTYYNFIYDESERLSRLINNVLHLARMTRNEQHAVLKEVTVMTLVDEVRSKVSAQIEQAGFILNIECNQQDELISIKVDEDWFMQIMINLIDNAIKFSANAERKLITLSCEKNNKGRIVFSVRDYGQGVDKQQMTKIFKLFYRSENELTRETVGTGIGLALVHQMVVSMDGEIDVVNRSSGAEFRVSFSIL